MTMKHLLWLLLAVLLTSCATARRTASVRESQTKRDSVVTRDSVVMRDSVVIRYERSATDSTVVRDSVVVTLDTAGNVVKLEHYRNAERNRESSRVTASESQHAETQRGASQQTSQEATSRQEATSEKRQRGVPWYVWLTGCVIAIGVWGIVWYYTFGRNKEA